MEPEKVDTPKRGRGRPPKPRPDHLRLADELDDGGQVPIAPMPAGESQPGPPQRAPLFGFQRKVPARPAGLSKDARWFWDYVTEQAASFGLLKPLDGPALHVMAETYGRWREAVRMRVNHKGGDGRGLGSSNSQGMNTAYWVGIEERASLQFMKMCQEFGLTPAAERHVEDVGIGGTGAAAGPSPAGVDSGGGDDNPF